MEDKPRKRIRSTVDETQVRHVQCKISPKEYDELQKYVDRHGISMNLALRGIVVDALSKQGAELPDNVETTRERHLVHRMLLILRSGNYVAQQALMRMLDALERMLLKEP